MFLKITHFTRYEYSQPVVFSPHALYLRPRETPRQRVHDFRLDIKPLPHRIPTSDAEGNALEWAYFEDVPPADALEFYADSLVETLDTNPFDFFLKPSALTFPFAYDPAERISLGPCLAPPADAQRLESWLEEHLPQRPADTVPFLTELNLAVRRALRYGRRDEEGIQTAAETLDLGGGSCRDYAVFFIDLCRHLGLAARFVSGYLHEPPPPDVLNPLPPAMHAWAEVYLPGAGWRGLDATRGIFCDDSFVPVAHSAVPSSVNPIQGTFYATGRVTSKLITRLTLAKF